MELWKRQQGATAHCAENKRTEGWWVSEVLPAGWVARR